MRSLEERDNNKRLKITFYSLLAAFTLCLVFGLFVYPAVIGGLLVLAFILNLAE